MSNPFGDVELTAAEQRALDQAEADIEMLHALVQRRRDSGLSQAEVADEMGRDKSSVCRFERLDSDPRMSTVRRYAGAIGALVTHHIYFSDPGDLHGGPLNMTRSTSSRNQALIDIVPNQDLEWTALPLKRSETSIV
ncbi:hypothetical protein ABM90_31075 [Rhodococcus erythropolis]|nr:hypothetical protein ABM90_31075 [Rhodococcus erythropolis]